MFYSIGLRLRRISALALILILAAASLPAFSVSAERYSAQGVNVYYRTAQEIRDYVKNGEQELMSYGGMYAASPSLEAPYTVVGELDEEAENYAITMLNNIRFIAGLDPVTLDTDLQELAQTGSDVCCAMGTISHYPKNDGYTAENLNMDSGIFESGCTATSQSNLAYRMMSSSSQIIYEYTEHCDNIMLGLMADEDQYNIDVVGHRRWMINPKMGKTGYGQTTVYTGTVYKDFGVLYAFDRSNTSASQYGVMWPAQTMPVEYFGNNVPWSISMGYVVEPDNVRVTLTRLSDGAVWEFSNSKSDGFFNVNNGGYGQKGCIIFRPDGVEYNVGDSFLVNITGLSSPVSYEVDFMSLWFDSAKEAGSMSHLSFANDPETGRVTLIDCDDGAEDIVIPALYRGRPVTDIGQSLAFCENVKTVVIPDSVTAVGDWAFYSCSALTDVTFGGSVQTVGYGAFRYCGKLKTVTLTNSLKSIDSFAFYNCDSITDVYFYGTEYDWNGIDFGYGNSSLKNATVHYVQAQPEEPDLAVQLSSDKSTIRFIAAVESLDYIKVGFELTVTDPEKGTVSAAVSDDKVYGALLRDDSSITSADFGVDDGYLFILTLNNIPSEFSVSVRPFATDKDGTVHYADAKEYSVKDGKIE